MRKLLVVALLSGLAAGACTPGQSSDGDGDVDADVDSDADADGSVDDGGCRPGPETCCSDTDCTDGIFCNGSEICDRGRCEPGLPRDCADGLDCTRDQCDEAANRCVHTPVNQECDDGDMCNGEERCRPMDAEADGRGCIAGTPVRCDDGDPCTDDYCEAGACMVRVRDADRDGYGDYDCAVCDPLNPSVCVRGDDCNDSMATVYPGAPEICDDGVDNNCDRVRDYADPACVVPNDTCGTALVLTAGRRVFSSTRGTLANIDTACGAATDLDVAFVFTIVEPRDVEVRFSSSSRALTASLTADCGTPALEVTCGSGRDFELGARGLAAGTYYVVASSTGEADFGIELVTRPPFAGPTGDLCATAPAVAGDGGAVTASLLGALHDYELGCAPRADLFDLAYELTVPADRTADLAVAAPAGSGTVAVAVHRTCGLPTTEVGCFAGEDAASGRIWRLTTGTYYVIVAAETEVDLELTVALTDMGTGLYLVEDFTSMPSGWTLSGQWQWGTPSGVGPTAEDGPCIGTVIGGNYPNSMSYAVDYAQSPSISLSGASAPVLRFRGWVSAESCCDGGQLEISVDGGTFTKVTHPSLTPAYTSTSYGWTGSTLASWRDFSVSLADYVGRTVAFRFAFRSDGSVVYPGWYVDHVMVLEP